MNFIRELHRKQLIVKTNEVPEGNSSLGFISYGYGIFSMMNLSCESHRKESSQRESGECGEIGIFGSVARNEHQAGSDLDVFVELQQDGIYA
jgi:hypothetical protein